MKGSTLLKDPTGVVVRVTLVTPRIKSVEELIAEEARTQGPGRRGPPYPMGIKLISEGKCPVGAISPMACMFCDGGHMMECHWPLSCSEAKCNHYRADRDPFEEEP